MNYKPMEWYRMGLRQIGMKEDHRCKEYLIDLGFWDFKANRRKK